LRGGRTWASGLRAQVSDYRLEPNPGFEAPISVLVTITCPTRRSVTKEADRQVAARQTHACMRAGWLPSRTRRNAQAHAPRRTHNHRTTTQNHAHACAHPLLRHCVVCTTARTHARASMRTHNHTHARANHSLLRHRCHQHTYMSARAHNYHTHNRTHARASMRTQNHTHARANALTPAPSCRPAACTAASRPRSEIG
jgi:hypothetical protein